MLRATVDVWAAEQRLETCESRKVRMDPRLSIKIPKNRVHSRRGAPKISHQRTSDCESSRAVAHVHWRIPTYVCICVWTCVRLLREPGSAGNERKARQGGEEERGPGESGRSRERRAPVMDRPISAARWSTRETEREEEGTKEGENLLHLWHGAPRTKRGEERREVMVGSVSC